MTPNEGALIGFGLLLLLLAGSSPQLVGDGREYVAQAINFASFHGPAIRTRDIDRIQSEMARLDPSLAAWDIGGRGAVIEIVQSASARQPTAPVEGGADPVIACRPLSRRRGRIEA